MIFRFDAPLFFANARTFREQVRALARAEPRPSWIIVAAEPITDVDTTAADMLRDLDEDLNADGIHLVFAEMKDPVRRRSTATSSRGRSTRRTSSRRSTPRSTRSRPRRERSGSPAARNTEPGGPEDLPGAMPVGDPDDLISSVG